MVLGSAEKHDLYLTSSSITWAVVASFARFQSQEKKRKGKEGVEEGWGRVVRCRKKNRL